MINLQNDFLTPAGRYLTILMVICCTSLSYAKTDVPVFLLSGQSNMTGYAAAADLTADQKKSIDNVKIYMDLVWEGDASKLRKWLTLGPGFGSNINNIGPELFLGRTLSDSMPGQKIALVKCCSGSTYLGQTDGWLPPSSNNGTGGTLYVKMMNTIDVAIKAFSTAFDTTQYTPRWAGFIWLQGEFDATKQDLSNAYEKNLNNLINDVRAKLKVADLPVIIPMIDVQNQWTYYTIVRAANVAMKQKLKNVDTLDTKGFPTDGTHYKGQGQVKIGTITAQRWLNMKFNYSPGVAVVFHSPNSMTSRQMLDVQLLPNNLFDLSGRRVSVFQSAIGQSLPHNGVYISKVNQYGELLGQKLMTLEK